MNKACKCLCTIIVAVIVITSILLSFKLDSYAINNKFILVLVNRTHFDDIANLPNIRALIDNGSIGLMNTRGPGAQHETKSYATIGWGVRAEADSTSSIFHKVNDENKLIYERRTGNVIGEGIINLDINSLIDLNKEGEYGATPGILGDLLDKEGLKSVLIGNSNTDATDYNPAGLILMNNKGYITYGEIDNVIEKDPLSSFGIRTNYEEVLKIFKSYYESSDLIVIETGDINRLEKYKENLNNVMYLYHKSKILNEVDSFIGNLVNEIDFKKSQLMIITPFPAEEKFSLGDRLTPVIYYGANIDPGVLYSSTTRRNGIVGNVDIGPTILNSFNVEPSRMVGNPIDTVSLKNNYNYLIDLNSKLLSTSIHRYRVLYTYAVLQMLISVITVVAILLKNKFKLNSINKWLAYALLCALVFPFTLLILSLFGPMGIVSLYTVIIFLTILIVLICCALAKCEPLKYVIYITGTVMTALVIDLVLGQPLIKGSIFGYDPIIGARYYGLGNEYMGILIGATLIFTASLLDYYRFNYKYITPIFIIVLLAIGFPIWGANVGGTITASAVFIFAVMRFSKKKIGVKKVLFILFSVVTILSIIALFDIFVSQNKSHLAKALGQIADNGPIVIFQIIKRKITMNLRIMSVTVWSRVLLIAMVILAVIFYHPIGIFKKLANEYPNITIGLGSIVLGSKVAFLVNDSGIVAAATIMMFLTTTILYLIISDSKKFVN
ncbi:hypothetical protein [Serpentinicella alkaliphila]|uniref:Uncharacterized protein n=1 Tax=Serpentinicella alkaliphila TaxID=1734049 RepID=A0A4R2TBC4_9FIRM|nr:hypothetical protein [Serpentinicella alkaliphila]QUH26684.1 hypothetical protein HZR23_13760 [Serpentinicella alkaliphila]TCQ00518.1 hypothetical protein EDD79_10306 [Serpentinicella alkaliphila]